MKRIPVLLVFLLGILPCWAQQTVISGRILDQESGENLVFASVQVKEINLGTTTNEYGFFSLTVNDADFAGEEIEVLVSYVGYATQSVMVKKGSSKPLKVGLADQINKLKTVEVKATRSKQTEELNSTQMSTIHVPMEQIAYIPSLGGETDILKVMQLMPGVSRGTEGTTGMFVRGGDADQNLVLLDEAPVYNVGHLFGFFSVFNSDAIKDMTMIKGGFPAHYGGRLSSILDIRMKDGHHNKFHGSGGVGLLSSKLTLEGPIVKEKASFLVSARRTYIDQVVSAVGSELPYYFYDLNAKLNVSISDKDRIYYSGYIGKDVLKFSDTEQSEDGSEGALDFRFGFDLGNITNTLRWNHVYSSRLFSNVSLINTNFDYNINGKFDSNNLLIKSKIQDYTGKVDYQYYASPQNTIKFGATLTQHVFRPNVISTSGEISEFLESGDGGKIDFQETAVYFNSDRELIGSLLKVNFGGRFSASKVESKFYTGIEPRLSLRYSLTEFAAVKASYSRMKQYLHRVSSSTVALPTDLWYPVTDNVKPQSADQVAVGFHYLFPKLKTALTIEGYYKWMDNLIEYREGANLILNNNFEDELVQGKGDSYGMEFLLKRDEGRFIGWIGYTLSWATRDFEELNGGKTFFAKYDRRHDLSIVGTYKISKRLTFAATWVYATGSRFTARTGQYLVPNPALTGIQVIPIYTERNAVAMSASHRLDLNFVVKSKEARKFRSEWHFGGYNIYNRATPYRINITPIENGIGYKYEQPGLFGFIPSIAYNFKF